MRLVQKSRQLDWHAQNELKDRRHVGQNPGFSDPPTFFIENLNEKARITASQDRWHYLARELLSDGFEVHGIVRRSSSLIPNGGILSRSIQ